MLLVFTSLFKLFHSIGVGCGKLAFPCFTVLTLGKLSLIMARRSRHSLSCIKSEISGIYFIEYSIS